MCCGETSVKIFSNGTCLWHREYQLSITHCPIDISWFPFDDQVCKLVYESKTHESRELNFTGMSSPIELANYIPSNKWKLLGITHCALDSLPAPESSKLGGSGKESFRTAHSKRYIRKKPGGISCGGPGPLLPPLAPALSRLLGRETRSSAVAEVPRDELC